ncbi:hypothetical protein EV200_107112 [Pedobacter psychrotolerans]|uniref:Glycosyl-4,4'-diaponeurosporenoate acyltransferase n=1 Tax=Pedobacter psychrotolerans TaxID=1843235 RepID=A0A4R2H6A6_9SPHI|nr:hypothetical protein [Pedobacter psychrotolerans]TCO21518.1 hypothetical protein EV200_107112 [Pedobacter psychrotolerans]GGE39206.1 hypothetical protein GCM10011413_01030 [Pedobacter psychrotolerans]
MVHYLTFSISITFISWIVGIMVNTLLLKTEFYSKYLSNLLIIKNQNISNKIGLGIFKWLVQNSFFKYFNPKLSIKKQIKPGELDQLRNEMTTAEIGHLIAFGFVMIFACVMIFKGKFLFALIITIVNILMNLYPSLLQQENKRRIDQFKNKMNSKILAI